MAKLARLLANEGAHEHSGADVRRIPRLRTRYYAFLSYSHKDKDVADWLHRELEKFRVPNSLAGRLTATGVVPRRLTPIFRDEHDLSAADDLGEEIKAALAGSQFLVVLCSPAAANSRWTNAEIESFKRTRPEGCVLAAVAAGEPFASDMAGREAEECFPPALRFKYDRRGHRTSKRAEPLAADMRGGPDERRIGFLKLVAGMLGVGLDELVQRETTRKHRQLAYVAAASLAGMAVTSTLAVTAFQARNTAREQRREAERLVEFMVGDLRTKLEPIGRLDALDGVGSRVLAYYSKQDTSELTDDALLQRSRALNLMAEVAFNRGNLEEAQGLYAQAAAGTAEAVGRSPADPKRLFEHAQNVFYVGEVARFAGEPVQAEAAYREYKRIADRMSSLEPDNVRYRMEVLYADQDVGISLYDQHRFAEAAALFQGAADPMEKLAALYPGDTSYQKEFSSALAWVADAHRSLGQLDAAVAIRQRQVSLLTQLLSKAADSDVRAKLITAHQGLGLVLADKGDFTRGIAEMNAAVTEAEGLIPVEPRNALWRSLAAVARLDLARTLLSLGRVGEAAQHTAAGCALGNSLPARYTVLARTRLRIGCATAQSRLALAAGDRAKAMEYAQHAMGAVKSARTEDPMADRYRLAAAYRLIGDIQRRDGDLPAASGSWTAALSVLPANVAERPWEMSERLQLLQREGRADEAAVLLKRLASIGFRNIQ
jgi:eukaryotic-like serine/threonine-protein kinase